MENLLQDETAVVTGGASGFGREIALTFADHGADVIVADIREDPREGGEPTHERIASETDRSAHYVECDVTNPGDLEVAVDAADELGGIDIMVNNAGITNETDFLEVTEEEYNQLMSINVKGVFFGCQAAGKKMLDNGGGKIVNMSSAAAYRAMAELSTYSASKAAVRTLTYAVADRLGGNDIRVNSINPGFSNTQMLENSELGSGIKGRIDAKLLKQTIPAGRFGEAEEVANVALFLASDMSSYVNGESILVDGGMIHT
ncbi:SDR family oxidoreductase [Halohasta litorea]|uniref:SDR family oxidoreductase n=1 Tax=Halohasta litorea TaxID=869891 RepID=A0ABD6D8Z5_9EURY|nr:SDR family oxidoreductase [Halohasta litorea]MEA1932307.1 SDR family oxidoreductase [Euryarchaeota archaeon]